MRIKIIVTVLVFVSLFALTSCQNDPNPLAEYTTVTCLFTGTDSTETPDNGTIFIEYNDTIVTTMTQDGDDVYTSQEEINSYIDAKFEGDHYAFIENRVEGFENYGYTCTYE